MKVICLECGKDTPKSGMKYCSRKCTDKAKSKRNREQRVCLFCKGEFEVQKSNQKRICSEACRKQWEVIPENIEKRTNASKAAILYNYGVENLFQLTTIKDKSKQTKLERYGDEFYNNGSQNRKTCLENFGVEYASQSPEIKAKVKVTIKQRYGVEHHLQLTKIIAKQKQTNFERYGVEYAPQNSDVKIKRNKAIKDRYGVDNISQSQEIKDKKKETSIKNFGVSHHLKDSNLLRKHFVRQFKLLRYKETEHFYQGSYELYFLTRLDEGGFLNEVQNPRSFEYEFEGGNHVYHPDFYFRGNYIEIKSGWTYNKNGGDLNLQRQNEAKWQAVKNEGERIIILKSKEEIDGYIEAQKVLF